MSMIPKSSKRVGLAVVDMQTFHRGHNALLNEMRMNCDRGIIGLGSVRQFGIHGHPFTFEQRVEMIRRIHGDFFEYVPLDDIDASQDIKDWYSYVEMKITKAGLPLPTDYFSGSRVDAKWYFHAFSDLENLIADYKTASVYEATNEDGVAKRLHIVNRELTGLPSGREIRLLIETRDEDWKSYVAPRLHSYIDYNYPPALRLPVDFDAIFACEEVGDLFMGRDPALWFEISLTDQGIEVVMERFYEVYPVGTLLKGIVRPEIEDVLMACGYNCTPMPDGRFKVILEKKDDGKWRNPKVNDEKSEWAKNALKSVI